MSLKKFVLGAVGAAVLAAPLAAPAPALAEDTLYLPKLVYRTGPFAPGGIPTANGASDYWAMINERDGGVNGARVIYEECEFGYNTDRGVECYERTKTNHGGALIYQPYSTGVTYALTDRTRTDKIPLLTMGYGRSDAGVGTAFPWVFPLMTNYWGQATGIFKYISEQEGGIDAMKDKTIALVYLDIAYGKESIPIFRTMSEKFGFTLKEYPVTFPGLEQKATWLQVRRARPDYIVMWGWGAMNQTAIKEAAGIRFPAEKFIGNWWAGAEQDTVPAGDAAIGYKSATFNVAGKEFPVIQEIVKHVYGKGNGAGEENVGQVLYNRSVVTQTFIHAGILAAQEKFGVKAITSEQLRWGMENIKIDDATAAKMGITGMVPNIAPTCEDHIGGGSFFIQQWDGKKWNLVSEPIEPMNDLVVPAMQETADKYLKEKGLEPATCG
ncbi:ABC transporter substrate-binding protein [Sneathiella chinensis]|uniref:ABC transporter permease n=1 Tax=Sneathiella chinensis TaxID=349750 RepID=A0ABQ5U912_9PROT|nr:ABC transporter substrate-binding protein [Sneathiella chinensis]GLQ07812.1 ABC transporter permease [Sneathiella chinensis]